METTGRKCHSQETTHLLARSLFAMVLFPTATAKQIYIDAGHVTEEGNLRIASKIAPAVGDILTALEVKTE